MTSQRERNGNKKKKIRLIEISTCHAETPNYSTTRPTTKVSHKTDVFYAPNIYSNSRTASFNLEGTAGCANTSRFCSWVEGRVMIVIFCPWLCRMLMNANFLLFPSWMIARPRTENLHCGANYTTLHRTKWNKSSSQDFYEYITLTTILFQALLVTVGAFFSHLVCVLIKDASSILCSLGLS